MLANVKSKYQKLVVEPILSPKVLLEASSVGIALGATYITSLLEPFLAWSLSGKLRAVVFALITGIDCRVNKPAWPGTKAGAVADMEKRRKLGVADPVEKGIRFIHAPSAKSNLFNTKGLRLATLQRI